MTKALLNKKAVSEYETAFLKLFIIVRRLPKLREETWKEFPLQIH